MRALCSHKGLCVLGGIVAALVAPAVIALAAEPTTAVRTTDFLNSIGVNSAINKRGETLPQTIQCAKYLGFRWIRSGPEGGVFAQDVIELHQQTGVRVSWGSLSGGTDLTKLMESGRQLDAAGALLAFEGPNEPNNWGFTYEWEEGGKNLTWLPIAKFQRNLYRMVKSDPALKKYPVWSLSEGGAATNNVGLQYLTIPEGAQTLLPAGTRFADFANAHNYFYHPASPGLEDNKTWNAADPGPACKVDGLYGEYGATWAKKFKGYSEKELQTLPRVTTETGTTIGGVVTEDIHALNLLTLYLDQYKRGWSYTAMYLMRDRVDEGGNQTFGFYRPDYTPRKAGVYLHNLTTILADKGALKKPGKLAYAIADQPTTVHDLLLQRSDGTFQLVVWGEQIKGSSTIKIDLGGKYPSVAVYDPTVGTDPVQKHTGIASLTVTLSDHPLILTIPSRR